LNKFQLKKLEVRAELSFAGDEINYVSANFSAETAKLSASVLVKHQKSKITVSYIFAIKKGC